MIATRILLFPRRVVDAFFLFFAIGMTLDIYLSFVESWRPTWTTLRTNVIVERSARATTAETNSGSTSNAAHAASPIRKMTMRASRGAGPTLAVTPSDSALARTYGTKNDATSATRDDQRRRGWPRFAPAAAAPTNSAPSATRSTVESRK